MRIQVDSREHQSEWSRISKQFDALGVKYFRSKLFVGDYMNLDNPRLVIDRKQNLIELCSNVTTDHERFRREMLRASENEIKIIFLCEHGDGIESLEDVIWWNNPRRTVRKVVDGKWTDVETKATTGPTLYNILTTIQSRYGVEFLFCRKEDTGAEIVRLLENDG